MIDGVHIEHTVRVQPAARLSVCAANALPETALTEVEHDQHDDQHNAQHSSAGRNGDNGCITAHKQTHAHTHLRCNDQIHLAVVPLLYPTLPTHQMRLLSIWLLFRPHCRRAAVRRVRRRTVRHFARTMEREVVRLVAAEHRDRLNGNSARHAQQCPVDLRHACVFADRSHFGRYRVGPAKAGEHSHMFEEVVVDGGW